MLLQLILVLLLPSAHGFPLHFSHLQKTVTTQHRFDKQREAVTATTATPATRRLILRFASTTPPTKDVNDIKHDIEELRQEALRRLDALNHKLEEEFSSHATDATDTPVLKSQSSSPNIVSEPKPPAQVSEAAVTKEVKSVAPSLTSSSKDSRTDERAHDASVDNRHQKAAEAVRRSLQQSATASEEDLNLLDGTHWKVMLNIGREPGTWMPKTWGASSERLLLNLEVEFTPNQLYDREEFLHGMAGAKELRVLELSTAPSMSEGSRPIAVQPTGGWRIAQGEGPAGTDLLRFYVQVEEEVRHRGCDVCCPAGRVYFTCGYFPLTHRDPKSPSLKDLLREEHDAIFAKYDQIQKEMEEDSSSSFIISGWDRLKRSKELMDLRAMAAKVARRIDEASLREPEKASLRLSRKRDVGLTQEGGLCCKVIKGVTMEYHILGKFGVASSEHHYQQHQDRHQELHP